MIPLSPRVTSRLVFSHTLLGLMTVYIQVLYDRRQTVILVAETVLFRWSMMRSLNARGNESRNTGKWRCLVYTTSSGDSPIHE